MRKLASLAIATVLIVGAFVAPSDSADAFEQSNNSVLSLSYKYSTNFTMSQSFKDRIDDAADEWDTNAYGYVTYDSSALNEIGYGILAWDTIARAGTVNGCVGADCWLYFNYYKHFCNEFYYGTGTTMGQSNQPQPWCDPPREKYDAWGVLVHELGHWRALHHRVFAWCNEATGAFAPAPTNDMASMCYSTSAGGIADRRTISQDEIQGSIYVFWDKFDANESFEICDGCSGGTDEPTYWMIKADSNKHWRAYGYVAINDGTTIAYPEVYQRVRGESADADNDGRFEITATVKAVADSGPNHRAVFFVRHVHGTTIDHEAKCPTQAESYLTPGVIETVTCEVNLAGDSSSNIEFEYGMRVTNKVVLYDLSVRDM